MAERGITLETMVSNCKEVYVQSADISITANTWANRDGCSFMVHGKGPELSLRIAGSLRWEELDALLVALNAVRAA